MIRTLRALAFAIAIASMTLSGCDKGQKPTAVAATGPESTTAAAEPGTTCAERGLNCEEWFKLLEKSVAADEEEMAKKISESSQSCWKADVNAFRRSVDSCNDLVCKEKALLARIATLQQNTHRASFQLPQTPVLLAVLGPDIPSSPPDSNLEFEARGSLIHAGQHPEHMGIAVSADGKDHVFLFEMDIDTHSSQDEVLGLVGTSPTTQVLVRGYSRVAPTGVANFDTSQCRWVYELL